MTPGHFGIVIVFVLLDRQLVFPAELGQMVSKEEIKKRLATQSVCLPLVQGTEEASAGLVYSYSLLLNTS